MMGGNAQIRACLRPRVPRAMLVRAEEAARAGRRTYFSLQTVTATFFTPVAFRRTSPADPSFVVFLGLGAMTLELAIEYALSQGVGCRTDRALTTYQPAPSFGFVTMPRTQIHLDEAAYFVRYSSPSAHARLTVKLAVCSPGILSQPPFSM
jgi:hypothetical protein